MKEKKVRHLVLILINIILVSIAIFSSAKYSRQVQMEHLQMEKDTFCQTIESMKQVSINYLEMEKGYVQNWAAYIKKHDMTMQEALEYIRESNIQEDRYAHIVDMDTYQVYSSYEKNKKTKVDCYEKFKNKDSETNRLFIKTMELMFQDKDSETRVLGRYWEQQVQSWVMSVGTKVTIKQSNGSNKDYLLLRLIPIESFKKIWTFPVDYRLAQIGMITNTGSYVIQSNAMKSQDFFEFIRSYNYENDYNEISNLISELQSTKKGLLEYKDSKNEECYWYYSALNDETGLYILGYIPVSSLENEKINWVVVCLISVIFIIMLVLDISYIMAMNKSLRNAVSDAREANEAKTRFLSSMSHDIRTPMNAVIGMTEIAKKHIDDKNQVLDCLNKVSVASKHLLTLINDILDISKVESGKMVLSSNVFVIEELLENLINMIRSQVDAKKLELKVNIEPFKYSYLVADELRLNQIFVNILTNAIKYTPSGGKICLDVKEEVLEEKKVRLVYKVSDSGLGMSEEFQKNMYDSFSRVVDSRIDKIQGTGLGLAIVKQMVDLMNGTIECESELGQGTTFTIYLDVEIANSEQILAIKKTKKRETLDDNLDLNNINILIAEDNDLNWEVIEDLLSEEGANCERAENGKECVTKAVNSFDGQYDLILMDVQMPIMNGREATREIRRSNRAYLQNIIIYAMTADAFAEDVQACMDAGMDGHLSKPIDMNKVRNVLHLIRERKESL